MKKFFVLMFYKKLKPSLFLQSTVDAYFFWESNGTTNLQVETPPNGYNAMVFNYGDPYQVLQQGQTIHPATSFLTGFRKV